MPCGAELVDEFQRRFAEDGDLAVVGFDLGGTDVFDEPLFFSVGMDFSLGDAEGAGGFVIGDGGGHGDDIHAVAGGHPFFEKLVQFGMGGKGFDTEHPGLSRIAIIIRRVGVIAGEECDSADVQESQGEVETGFAGEDVAPIADFVDLFAGGSGGDQNMGRLRRHVGSLCEYSTTIP